MPVAMANRTILDAILETLKVLKAAPDGIARPAAILWTDPKSQFLPLKDRLMDKMPEMLTLGAYSPDTRTGPAIWLRCVVDGTIPIPGISPEVVPVVYLPGVARQDLRAGEDCPEYLFPLVELLYRGTTWLQRNSADWTVMAFLISADTLGLDIVQSQATKDALYRALPHFAALPLSRYIGRRLETEDFDLLLVDDPVRDLLRWMSNPSGRREQMDSAQWQAFCSQCRQRFRLDPERDGEIAAGERLGNGDDPWAAVWERYAEAPSIYPGIVNLLKLAQPQTLTMYSMPRWPAINEDEENSIKAALTTMLNVPDGDIYGKIESLEQHHGVRRSWLWSHLGLSPLAAAMKPLAKIASIAKSAMGGATSEEMAENYAAGLWLADAASWEVVADAPIGVKGLIKQIVSLMMRPWLDNSALAFQRIVRESSLPLASREPLIAEPEMCLLFVDGLRYDVGQKLADNLREKNIAVYSSKRFAPLPTVTATGKPAASPAALRFTGEILDESIACRHIQSGRVADTSLLRTEIRQAGYQLVECDFPLPPANSSSKGWAEYGNLDSRGHDLQEDLPSQIMSEIQQIADRVSTLLQVGWKKVRIVTDHGWLYLSGGLPRIELPHFLTITRWSRCAVISGESRVETPRYSWHWNASQYFASPPGIACFNFAPAYAHGGVSIQECLLPDLIVESGGGVPTARILSVVWTRMRCTVEADTNHSETKVDIRLRSAAGQSVAQAVKRLDENGTASLVVDTDYEESDLFLVLVGPEGNILAQQRTRVGDHDV